MFKQKKEKMETEIDSSTLDNLEKGFAIQGAQLKKAQEEILSYQQSLHDAYQKIQDLYNELNDIKTELKCAKDDRDSLKKQIEKLSKPVTRKTSTKNAGK